MKSIVLFVFIFVTSSFALSSSEDEELHAQYRVDDLLDHYKQLDLAPFGRVDKAKNIAENAMVKTAAAFIHRARFDDAKRLLNGIRFLDVIDDIVQEAYDGIFKRTINIIEFIRSMDSLEDQMKGFSALYDEIKRKSDLQNPAIIEIAYWLKQHAEQGEVELETDEFIERFLYYDTEKYSIINEAIEYLALKLRNGDKEEVEILSKKYPGAFSVIISKLVEVTYNREEKNVPALLSLVDSENLTPAHKESMYEQILERMQKYNHTSGSRFRQLKDKIMSTTSNVFSGLKKKVNFITG